MSAVTLTPDLMARAIIAAAVNLRDFSAIHGRRESQVKAIMLRGPHPAAIAIALEAKRPLVDICRILQIEPADVAVARSFSPAPFKAAQEAAREAIRYHLAGLKPSAAPEAPTAPPSAAEVTPEPEPEPPPVRVPVEFDEPMVVAPVQPAPQPRPAPQRSRGRALPRGSTVENMGGGVQRIRVQAVPASVARHAKQQLDRGAELDFVADCFGFEPDSLQAAVNALNEGNAA